MDESIPEGSMRTSDRRERGLSGAKEAKPLNVM